MYREFLTRNTRTRVTEYVFTEDFTLREDGYRIAVRANGRAEITYCGERGKRYAQDAISAITENGLTLIAEIEDYPSFPLRGIIEGFYGKPYTQEQRLEIIDFLAEHRMNAFFYAPKDDEYHRERWREPYPEELLEKIGELKRRADERNVLFYYCLSPGKDFRYADEQDYELILKKYEQIAALGVREFAVLFDDIPAELTDAEKQKFSSPGEAHARVANFLNRELNHQHKFLFCPTDYFQNGETPYRAAVREYLDKDVQVFWTGYCVVAEAISEKDCIAASEAFGHELVLWDNYPVNDFEPKKRIYFGEICNRTRKIAQYHAGCIANPCPLWESSKFALRTMAEWMWNAEDYDEEAAFRRAVEGEIDGSAEAYFFASLSRSSVMKRFPAAEEYFNAEDWCALDGYYTTVRKSVLAVRKKCTGKQRAEWEDLFGYALAECTLYRALREGKALEPLLAKIEKFQYRTADQSLLRYIAKKNLGRDVSFEERAVYWDMEKGDN